jgi:raffinose/stachyose/melibiose transport system permease protein
MPANDASRKRAAPGHLPWRRSRSFSVERVPWVFLLPALLTYSFVVLYPALLGSLRAFTDWNGLTQGAAFNGLDNFRRFFSDDEALAGLKHTVELALVIPLAQNVVGLILALALNSGLKTRQVLRLLFFTPVVLVTVVVAFSWQYIYTPDGPLGSLLGSAQQDWLGDPNLVLWSVAFAATWQFVGYSMVIFLAGLQGVPVELYEAAALDGAGAWRRFRAVTLPGIAPAMTINVMLTLVGTLKIFDVPFAMTGGGPGYDSNTLATYVYGRAFGSGEYGYGTAVGLVMTVLVVAVSLIVLRWLRRSEVTG